MHTEEQQQVINATPDKDYRIIATAGSGKTSCVVHFTKNLIETHKLDPSRILLNTFSVAATDELRRRLRKLTKHANKVQISTLHSLCYSICRDFDSPYSSRKVDNWAQWKTEKLIKDYLKTNYEWNNWKIDKVHDIVSSLYDAFRKFPDPKWLLDNGHLDEYQLDLRPIFTLIDKEKASVDGLDFDDMPRFALHALTTTPSLKDEWINKFDFIICDEFQDTDPCQFSVLTQLMEKSRLLVMGDPDQCIYKYRMADPDLMRVHLPKHRPQLKDFNISYNFRCGKNILRAAKEIIEQNKERLPINIKPCADAADGQVVYSKTNDLVYIEVERLIKAGCPPNEIAILNRVNASTFKSESLCLKNDIPYAIHGDYEFENNKAVMTILNYIKLIDESTAYKEQDVALESILNTPLRKIPLTAIKNVKRNANKNRMSVLSQTIKSSGITFGKPYIDKAMRELVNEVAYLRSVLKSGCKVTDLIRMIRNAFGLDDHFNSIYDEYGDYVGSMDAFQEITKDVRTLQDLYQMLDKVKDLRGKARSHGHIQILTGHKAKGLEFDVVFVHAEENKFPKRDCDDIESERRLFYVMVTRARKLLYLSGNSPFIINAAAAGGAKLISDVDDLWANVIEKYEESHRENLLNFDL